MELSFVIRDRLNDLRWIPPHYREIKNKRFAVLRAVGENGQTVGTLIGSPSLLANGVGILRFGYIPSKKRKDILRCMISESSSTFQKLGIHTLRAVTFTPREINPGREEGLLSSAFGGIVDTSICKSYSMSDICDTSFMSNAVPRISFIPQVRPADSMDTKCCKAALKKLGVNFEMIDEIMMGNGLTLFYYPSKNEEFPTGVLLADRTNRGTGFIYDIVIAKNVNRRKVMLALLAGFFSRVSAGEGIRECYYIRVTNDEDIKLLRDTLGEGSGEVRVSNFYFKIPQEPTS